MKLGSAFGNSQNRQNVAVTLKSKLSDMSLATSVPKASASPSLRDVTLSRERPFVHTSVAFEVPVHVPAPGTRKSDPSEGHWT